MKTDWEVKTLGEVCEIITDGVHNSPPYVEMGIPMLDSKHIDDNFRIDDSNPEKYISKETDDLLSKRCKPKKNDILISSRGSIGKIAIVREGQNFNIMGNIILLRLPKTLDTRFLVYSLHSELKNIEAIARGAAQKGLYLNQVRSFKVPLPPLAEQQRIVAILDEAFAAIDKAKENAQKNLQNARELFDSYLQSVFANPGEDWEEKKLGDLAAITSGYSFKSGDFSSENKIKSVKITNVGVREFVEESDNLLPENFKTLYQKFLVNSGDIVIALTRSIISAGIKVCIVPSSYDKSLLNQRVASIRAKNNLAINSFLYSVLCASSTRKYIEKRVNTLMQPNLSIKDLIDMPVLCPNVSDQQVIISKLDALSAETKKLEAIYQKKLTDLDELKKVILHKAFRGELTATSADALTA